MEYIRYYLSCPEQTAIFIQYTQTKNPTSCTGLLWSLGFTKSVQPNFLAENWDKLVSSVFRQGPYAKL